MKLATTKLDALREQFPGIAASEFRDEVRVVVPVSDVHELLRALHEAMDFDLLVDITCVDYLYYPVGWVSDPTGVSEEGSGQRPNLQEEGSGQRPNLQGGDRFGLVYLLASTVTNERITVRTFVNDPDPGVPTAVDLWEGANWLEREVWDMFGIRFAGHPDLRRILLPEEFAAHPLRKDYPLQGRGERHHFPVLRRG